MKQIQISTKPEKSEYFLLDSVRESPKSIHSKTKESISQLAICTKKLITSDDAYKVLGVFLTIICLTIGLILGNPLIKQLILMGIMIVAHTIIPFGKHIKG